MKQLPIKTECATVERNLQVRSPAVGHWSSNAMRAERLAHDLGNHFTAISGLAQVGRLMKTSAAKDGYFQRIEAAVSDMAGMVREGLALQQADLRELLDCAGVRELVGEILSLMQPRFLDKCVKLGLSYTSGIPTCRLAKIPLKQVLVNILDNALHATPSGGEVTISIMAGVAPSGLQMWVQDNGIGIPKDHLSQVCSPGFTTRADGYGLGLSVSREVVEVMHGGQLSLSSQVDCGTTVHIFLPC